MRILCPDCNRYFQKMGFARHQSMHYDNDFRWLKFSYADSIAKNGAEETEKAIAHLKTIPNGVGLYAIKRSDFEKARIAMALIGNEAKP